MIWKGGKKVKYYVRFKIDARYTVEIEADNLEEAREKANDEYIDADFGEAEDINGEAISVEDEDGNIIWEK